MTTDEKSVKLVSPSGSTVCHKCGQAMKQVSWKITAGAYDAGKEVEQFVFECQTDKSTKSIELTTGNPSEFAIEENESGMFERYEP